MYGAMREHAPQSTRFAGAITATAITLATGYMLAQGFGTYIANALPDPIVFVPLREDTPPAPPPPTAETLDTSVDTKIKLVAPETVLPDYRYVDPPITGSTDPTPPRSNPGPATPPQPPLPRSVRIAPQIIPVDPPPYPPIGIRTRAEGDSLLTVCLDARGRVTSAALAATSGHTALDQAALKWVRTLKFKPLTVDGAAQPICNHTVTYEWRLDSR